ncbi:MAG: hypothetical protein HZC01_03055 [Candidatus Kerfeldbacteria bacterium]|nr:hypothetical protein [Candidatus Kerfeldbacteria bacterium]
MSRAFPTKRQLVAKYLEWAHRLPGYGQVTAAMVRSIPAEDLRRWYFKGEYPRKGWSHIGNQNAAVKHFFEDTSPYMIAYTEQKQRRQQSARP